MLKKVRRYINLVQDSDESFHQYFLKYMMKMQDQSIAIEVSNQIKFGLLQLSQYDQQIETDYRKLVNESAKFN